MLTWFLLALFSVAGAVLTHFFVGAVPCLLALVIFVCQVTVGDWAAVLLHLFPAALFQYLDEYMACVEDVLRDDSLGLMAVSFVQAGCMIESSSKVYGANIDYVWQLVTEVMEVLRINQ